MKLARWSCLVLALALLSCGGDDDKGTDGGRDNVIEGHAFKGRFTAGLVEAFEIAPGGVPGLMLGSGTVDGNGRYRVKVGDFSGPVLLRLSGGTFLDELHGPTAQAHAMQALITAPAPDVHLTPLTTIAASRALRLINQGGATVPAITRSNSMVAAYFGLPAAPGLPSILSEGPASPGAAADYGALLAAISQAANDLGVSADAYADALARDAADGVFDGMDGASVVMLGANPLATDAANDALAAALAAFLGSAANQSGLVAADFSALTAHLQAIGPELLFATTISVSPGTRTIGQGMQVSFRADADFSDGSSADVTAAATWDSSNATVAMAAASGVVTAQSIAGSADISAALDVAAGSAVLFVGGYTLSSISVAPAMPSVAIAGSVNFTATAHYSDLSTDDISDLVNWSSGAPGTLTVNGAGTGTGVAAGAATVTATEPGTGVFGSTNVSVYVSYSANLRFLFGQNCTSCHGGSFPEYNLDLSTYALAMSTGNSFPNVIIAGDAANSIIVQRLEGTITPQMPYQEPPLAAAQIQMVKDWINAGALNN